MVSIIDLEGRLFTQKFKISYPHGFPSPTFGQSSYLPLEPTGITTTCLNLRNVVLFEYCVLFDSRALFTYFIALKHNDKPYLIKNGDNFWKIGTHRSRCINNQKYCHLKDFI